MDARSRTDAPHTGVRPKDHPPSRAARGQARRYIGRSSAAAVPSAPARESPSGNFPLRTLWLASSHRGSAKSSATGCAKLLAAGARASPTRTFRPRGRTGSCGGHHRGAAGARRRCIGPLSGRPIAGLAADRELAADGLRTVARPDRRSAQCRRYLPARQRHSPSPPSSPATSPAEPPPACSESASGLLEHVPFVAVQKHETSRLAALQGASW